MSADEQVSIARVEQKVEDMDKTVSAFIAEIRQWRTDVDAERNRVKGAILSVGVVGGFIGTLLGWIGKNIKLSL